jgi:hypothetical protein
LIEATAVLEGEYVVLVPVKIRLARATVAVAVPPEPLVVQIGDPAVEMVRRAPVDPELADRAVGTRFVWA